MARVSRRDFLNGAATALAVAGLEGVPAAASAAMAGSKTDADLIVVGAGLAGLAAAITAADAGASVILIDKRYKIGGSAMGAGGSYSAAGSRQQREKKIEDTPLMHAEDAARIGRGQADPELLRLYCEQAAPTQAWLESLGVEFDANGPRFAPEHELYKTPRTCDALGGGPGFIAVLGRQLEARIAAGTVSLRGETTADRLVKERGRVVGLVVIDDAGRRRTLRAANVILASGGYGANRSMIRQYNPEFGRALTVASKYATGDGIRIAEAAGARLVNMGLMTPYFAGVENPPGSGRTMMISLISGLAAGFSGDIWVSRLGTRFMNEDSPSPDERERALRQVPDAAVFALFDDGMLKAAGKPPLFNFDAHLAAGLTVKKAPGIGALALEIGVPPQTLVNTIETYNGFVDAGRDAAFGRTALVKFNRPPFYAIVASGVIFMTMGGVQTNVRLQVVGAGGRVIPGLYAAGEVQGAAQWMGDGLISGAGNGAALVFGRLAAQAAVGS
ncbi:MAG: FAD-binding protein [Vicinamibacterales bacterium]|nr:FAD-binding protein [Vicinamibacterales bacterium]